VPGSRGFPRVRTLDPNLGSAPLPTGGTTAPTAQDYTSVVEGYLQTAGCKPRLDTNGNVILTSTGDREWETPAGVVFYVAVMILGKRYANSVLIAAGLRHLIIP
jgi:hypothetical protein